MPFTEFSLFCWKEKLISKVGIAIDGSKFYSLNSKENNFTHSKLDFRIDKLDGHITKFLTELDRSDLDENEIERLNRELQACQDRKKTYENMQKEMIEKNISQISLTDPESKLMKM